MKSFMAYISESVESACKKIDRERSKDPHEVASVLTGAELKDVARNKDKFMKTCKHKMKADIYKVIADIQG